MSDDREERASAERAAAEQRVAAEHAQALRDLHAHCDRELELNAQQRRDLEVARQLRGIALDDVRRLGADLAASRATVAEHEGTIEDLRDHRADLIEQRNELQVELDEVRTNVDVQRARIVELETALAAAAEQAERDQLAQRSVAPFSSSTQ